LSWRWWWVKKLEVVEWRWKLVAVEVGFLKEDDVVVGMSAGVVKCF
jgi:hypothetical protein